MRVSVVSGGFDPIHSGHIAYLNAARELGDKLIVALNSDAWLTKKKGQPFMHFLERKTILENLSCVDEVLGFEDDELGSCINALKIIKERYPNEDIIFCNGGDRNQTNIPEISVPNVELIFGVGGEDKKNSSSGILKNWQGNSEERIWGKFFNLYQDQKIKIKELIINPKKGISLQRHFKRDEVWFVSKGECKVKFKADTGSEFENYHLKLQDVFKVCKQDWHQIYNPFKEECRIIEIQYGEETSEEDIERLEFYEGNNE